jgi:glycosyltransferase involved in cell wall biosynthesis
MLSGTQWETIKQKRNEWNLQNKVEMIDKLPPAQLQKFTGIAHIGFSLDSFEDLNCLYNLPNKIFDYIHAAVPSIVTSIPEVENIMNEFKCGICINNLKPENLAKTILDLSKNETAYKQMKNNCISASKILCWENESIILEKIYKPFL